MIVNLKWYAETAYLYANHKNGVDECEINNFDENRYTKYGNSLWRSNNIFKPNVKFQRDCSAAKAESGANVREENLGNQSEDLS